MYYLKRREAEGYIAPNGFFEEGPVTYLEMNIQ